jgi:tetratricopeptide (TPR) repeat protein
LIGAEAARPSEDPDARDYILRGRAALYKGSTRENFAESIEFLEKALTLDATSVVSKALLGNALVDRAMSQLTDSLAADIKRAELLIEEALAAAPAHPLARFAKAQLLRVENRYEAAIPELEAAISRNRNWVVALAALGMCKLFVGLLGEAIPAQLQAIRLSPRDPYVPNWYWRVGMVHLLQARTDEAILWLEKARSANPRLAGPHAWLASAYALKDEAEIAVAELAEARRLSRDGRYESIAKFKAAPASGSPKTFALAETTFFCRVAAGRGAGGIARGAGGVVGWGDWLGSDRV